MLILEFIEQSNQCRTIEQLVLTFEQSINKLGFDKFVYSLMRGSASRYSSTHHGIARSYPEDWMLHYAKSNYLKFDPTYRWAMKHRGAFTWEQLKKALPMSKGEKRVMFEADDAGLKSGVSLSIFGPRGEVMGLGLASNIPNLKFSKDDLSALHALSNQFHLAYMALTEITEIPSLFLSDRQRDILQLMAIGKSRAEIAELLAVSENSIKAYIKDIYDKLGCDDKAVAVLRAFQLGLIAV